MSEPEFVTGSHDLPITEEYAAIMRGNWADTEQTPTRTDVSHWTPQRRAQLHAAFPNERLIVPAGRMKARSNDQYFRFRPHTAYVWLTGDQSSDGVYVQEPSGDAVLYLRPRSSRTDGEFYTDRKYGELWAGRRPTLRESSLALGIETRHISELVLDGPCRVLRDVDATIDEAVPVRDANLDRALAAVLSELRLIKDAWEVRELRHACDITTRGFEDVVRAIPTAKTERYLEAAFWGRARIEGNDVGYNSIVAAGAHATMLHWIENDGPIAAGDLLLLDAGVETRDLYTADITRVLPLSGSFTPIQRDLYELTRKANDAALAMIKPGVAYRAFHLAAMRVFATGLHDLGVLRVSVDEAIETGVYRRWTLCGSGHMLGLDVHDCAAARATEYLDGTLRVGHVLTVEPGLYLQPDDLLLPEELRGLGFRIEEDLVVTESGYDMLSDRLPRSASDVESWMQRVATTGATETTNETTE
jgi:Xaa-Pro aminopeptidase